MPECPGAAADGEPGPYLGEKASKCLAELIGNAFDDFNEIMIFII